MNGYYSKRFKMSFVLFYLDDINVFSRTFNEYVTHLEKALKRLAKAKLKLKPKKCAFFSKKN